MSFIREMREKRVEGGERAERSEGEREKIVEK